MNPQQKLARDICNDLPDALRAHVFNIMPARLLDVHDPGKIQVIGRAEVYELLKNKLQAYTEEKIRRWIEEQATRTESEEDTHLDRIQLSAGLVQEIARYAILSHRWLDIGEIVFNKINGMMFFKDLADQCGPREMIGMEKLCQFCTEANWLGCSFAWADTCCIDKSSSSELDEAIRSMFRWYRAAYVCIVHLAETSSLDQFGSDTWFKRGWTLQELLAPPRLKFFSKDWAPLCKSKNDKLDPEITQRIEERTTISESQLRDFQPGPFDIVRRMAWAADRVTTRIEDRGYSLIGIFDVNLIIAYGEGENAFGRLMEVIYNKRPHYEVFLWEGKPAAEHSSKALPASPASYRSYCDDDHDDGAFKEGHRENRERTERKDNFGDTNFALTNRGLRIKCLDVWVTLRCDPVRVGQDKWRLILRPWHPLSRDIEDVVVLVDSQTRDKFMEKPDHHSKAIGVLDYLRNESDDPGHVETKGRLVEGRDHFGWLLMCPTGYAERWDKVTTINAVRLRFKERSKSRSNLRSFERPLIQVHL
ncbi:hypothetical protein J3R83DRAFT_12507 [Lanmaoa asiatica]|nr:hypothetical protein J3R83DRAFT_12507 [Lanmaoa asiatica]